MGANVEEYFFRDTLKLWNNLPKSILSRDLEDFKSEMKSGFQPPKYKHFSKDQNWKPSLKKNSGWLDPMFNVLSCVASLGPV